jgi:hypothetical protein
MHWHACTMQESHLLLFLIVVKDGSAVLAAPVVTLPILLARVNLAEENRAQAVKGHLGGVICDLHSLRVPRGAAANLQRPAWVGMSM